MHITITGNLGSGKSTVCKYLSQKYSLEKYSTGDVQRALAGRMGMTTLELNLFMQSNPQHDRLIDDEVVKISEEKQNQDIIFDSRMAWHFVKKSFKVFLLVDIHVAAERVFNDSRGDVEAYASPEEAAQKLRARAASESERFNTFYHVDYFDLANYDLVVDTSICAPEIIAEVIYSEARRYYQEEAYAAKVLLSPRSIYPGAISGEVYAPIAEDIDGIDTSDDSGINSLIRHCPENIDMLIRVLKIDCGFEEAYPYAEDIVLDVVKYRDCFFVANMGRYMQLMFHILCKTPFISVRIIAAKPKDKITPNQTLEQYISKISRSDIFRFESWCHFIYPRHPDFLKE